MVGWICSITKIIDIITGNFNLGGNSTFVKEKMQSTLFDEHVKHGINWGRVLYIKPDENPISIFGLPFKLVNKKKLWICGKISCPEIVSYSTSRFLDWHQATTFKLAAALLGWPYTVQISDGSAGSGEFEPVMGRLECTKMMNQLGYNQPAKFSYDYREQTIARLEVFPCQHCLCWWWSHTNSFLATHGCRKEFCPVYGLP